MITLGEVTIELNGSYIAALGKRVHHQWFISRPRNAWVFKLALATALTSSHEPLNLDATLLNGFAGSRTNGLQAQSTRAPRW